MGARLWEFSHFWPRWGTISKQSDSRRLRTFGYSHTFSVATPRMYCKKRFRWSKKNSMKVFWKRRNQDPGLTWFTHCWKDFSQKMFFEGRTIRYRERSSATRRVRGNLQIEYVKTCGCVVMYYSTSSSWNFTFNGWRPRFVLWWPTSLGHCLSLIRGTSQPSLQLKVRPNAPRTHRSPTYKRRRRLRHRTREEIPRPWGSRGVQLRRGEVKRRSTSIVVHWWRRRELDWWFKTTDVCFRKFGSDYSESYRSSRRWGCERNGVYPGP